MSNQNQKKVLQTTKQVRTVPTIYSEDFKKKIIAEYLETNQTKREILDKYGIRSNSPLQKWMRKYGIIDPYAKKRLSWCEQYAPYEKK